MKKIDILLTAIDEQELQLTKLEELLIECGGYNHECFLIKQARENLNKVFHSVMDKDD